ncbi:MAG: hypothetical protein RL519_1712, partial [Pseudomonadota bacterium]
MSKQLALSIAASVLAMAAFVLFGKQSVTAGLTDSGPRWSIQADSSALP